MPRHAALFIALALLALGQAAPSGRLEAQEDAVVVYLVRPAPGGHAA